MKDDTIYHFGKVQVQVLKENKKSVFMAHGLPVTISCVLPYGTVEENNRSEKVNKRIHYALKLHKKAGKFRVKILSLDDCTELLSDQQKIDRGLPLITYNTKT
jgi:hypothetical protein